MPGVYAIGDVIGPRRIMLAHMAVAEAHTAVHNILHPEDRKAQRYDVVPSAIFTAPEIGDVGLSEAQAKQQGFAVKTSVFQFRELGKAQAMGELAGLFKLVVEEGSGKPSERTSPEPTPDPIAEATPRHPAAAQPAISSKPSTPTPPFRRDLRGCRFAGIALLRSCRRHKLEGSRTPFFSGCGCLFCAAPSG